MNALIALIAVLALIAVASVGSALPGLFGIVLPYLALTVFIVGVIYRLVKWGKAPVPFRIPTTCGQQKTHPWIKHDKYDNPATTGQVIVRMLLEVFLFRSLFRNTKVQLVGEGEERFATYGSAKALWLAGLAFHYTFLVILIRHLRFFMEPVPYAISLVEHLDGFFEIAIPTVFMSSLIFLAAVTYLFLRRILVPQMRYISLLQDYFPLFLILAIGITGILMRYFYKVDINAVKGLTVGLATFSPAVPQGVGSIFYIHMFLVCVLFVYFPFSKLMHMGGVFMSPTRNMANNNRAKHHENPWNYPVEVHTYEEYEDDFRERMVQVGLPVDKPLEKKE